MRRSYLNRKSAKKIEQDKSYFALRKEFLEKFPYCAVTWALKGKRVKSTQVHHILRRRQYTLNTDTWLPVSSQGHDYIERTNIVDSRARGWLYNPDIHGPEKNIKIKPFEGYL